MIFDHIYSNQKFLIIFEFIKFLTTKMYEKFDTDWRLDMGTRILDYR